MANNDENQTNNIRPNIEKIIFAEDLINYTFKKNSLPITLFINERQRRNGASIFDYLESAADFFIDTFGYKVDQTYHWIMDNNLNTHAWFSTYARTLRTNYLRNTYHTLRFFNYSIHLAHLAGKLFLQEFKEAPIMAARYITEAMDLDLFKSRKGILDKLALVYEQRRPITADNQRQSLGNVERPSPQRTGEIFVQATEVQMCIPHERLSQCKVKAEPAEVQMCTSHEQVTQCKVKAENAEAAEVQMCTPHEQLSQCKVKGENAEAAEVQMCTPHEQLSQCKVKAENVEGEEYTGGKASKCGKFNTMSKTNVLNNEKMDEGKATISSHSSCHSLSNAEFENLQKFMFDSYNINRYSVLSSDSIGVPESSRGGPTNLYSQECHSSDTREDENSQTKKPRLDDK